MPSLLSNLIRLAYTNKPFRKDLLPLVLGAMQADAKMLRKVKMQVIPGGRGEKLKPDDVDPKQLAKGRKVEQEHGGTPELQTEIALDHLEENPQYYDFLESMEEEF